MEDLARLLNQPDSVIALVGATDSTSKYGSIIFRNLTGKGLKVWPINPGHAEIHGQPCYPSLDALPEAPTIVNIVTPPGVSLEIVRQCKALGYRNVWLQPGAEDNHVIRFLDENDFNYLANACTMVASRIL